jgi:homoserine dehydrogenase
MKIAVMGYGTVGSGVVEIVEKRHTGTKRKPGDIEVKYILDIHDFPNDEFRHLLTKDVNDILNCDEIKIVVETMGGHKPAFDFVAAALKKGKSVVTSNKELVATSGAELLKLARENNANFLFEASVGGGIPLIRPLSQCLAANDILRIDGILNGTTNFIFTQMIDEGATFEDVLKEAQDLGYAEKDPTDDVEGIDAARKIAILASIAGGVHITADQVFTEGITKITQFDVETAGKLNCVIKLIATAKKCKNDKYVCLVTPALVSKNSLISNVNGVFNAVMVNGDSVGEIMLYGPGAGKLATASAVVADVLDCAKHMDVDRSEKWLANTPDAANDISGLICNAYVSGCGDINKATEVFGDVQTVVDGETYALVTKTPAPFTELKAKADLINAKIIRLI